MKTELNEPKINGNKFVSVPHLFVPGRGTFFPTALIAQEQARSTNGVGLWTETVEFQGATYFQCGYANCWD